MNKNLDRIEAQLRSLFEKSLLNIFTGNRNTSALIDDVILVMEQNLIEKPDGRTFAPDQFQLHVPSEELLEWQAHQDVLNEIAATIYELGLKNGFYFQATPSVTIHASEDIPAHRVQMQANFTPMKPRIADTAAVTPPRTVVNGTSVPKNAFLIVRGKVNFPLEKPVINIGRHSNNDLVLDDEHVSRHHAQLRAINQHFVIFDLGSTGGLFLNGKPISQATLQAGDVLRISTINLIYIQDTTSANPTTAMPVNINGDDIE